MDYVMNVNLAIVSETTIKKKHQGNDVIELNDTRKNTNIYKNKKGLLRNLKHSNPYIFWIHC